MSTNHTSRPDVQDTGYGFTIPKQFSLAAFRSALKYKPRPDDLFIVTFPKCGTTWMQNIVACIYKQGRAPFEDALDFFRNAPFLEMSGAEGAENMKRPGAIKMHLPFHLAPWSEGAKYIYVARNPKDCCVSFYNHVRNMKGYNFQSGRFDDYFELFIRGKSNFGDYFDHLRSWHEHKDEPNVLFVTYEELKADTRRAIIKVADFMGRQYRDMLENNQQMLEDVVRHSSFGYMKDHLDRQVAELSSTAQQVVKNEPDLPTALRDLFGSGTKLFAEGPDSVNFVRKGVVGDWKNYLSEEQSKRMDDKFREKTKGTEIANLWKGLLQDEEI